MIPRETVGLILDTARIEEVVSDYVTLKRRGANFVACCPFHNEKTPSFYVSPSKGIFKCFGCGKSGSAVGFVMEEEHCSYADALRYLARKYNIEIHEKEETAEDIARRQHSESLLLVSEFAQKFRVRPEVLRVAAFHPRGCGLWRRVLQVEGHRARDHCEVRPRLGAGGEVVPRRCRPCRRLQGRISPGCRRGRAEGGRQPRRQVPRKGDVPYPLGKRQGYSVQRAYPALRQPGQICQLP